MATPKEMLKQAFGPVKITAKITKVEESPAEEAAEPAINEMIEKVFCTRNAIHFSHWLTGSFSTHVALGELYEEIIDAVDNIVETYMGEFGKLKGLECCECVCPDDVIAQLKADSEWIKANRMKISNGSTTIQNLLDGLTGLYNRTIFKLTNLH
jgi:hypothetical protein